MQPYEVIHGDCLEVLRGMPDNSVDAVCTDPPYGLSKEPNIVEVLTHWINGDDYQHRGGGFMGRKWDSFVPGPAVWREVFRVMKPGAHALVFGGTRTVDLTVIALRMAGFQIVDQLVWMHGQGFPKSKNVSKALDAMLGVAPRVVGVSPNWRESKRDYASDSWEVRGENAGKLTESAIDLAKQWDGWGTGLKPAHEPVVLCRKPIAAPNIAANVAQWGTGALNIAATRIGTDQLSYRTTSYRDASTGEFSGQGQTNYATGEKAVTGRWPANVLLDEEAAAALDRMSGERGGHGVGKNPDTYTHKAEGWGNIGVNRKPFDYGDKGGPSRFYFVAKASKRERTCDGTVECDHPTVKPITLCRHLAKLICPPGGTVLDPFCGSGSVGCAAIAEGFGFIGIEQDEGYVRTARARMAHWAAQRPEAQQLALTGD